MTKFSSIVESKLNDLTSLSEHDEEVKSLLSEAAAPVPPAAMPPAVMPQPAGGGKQAGFDLVSVVKQQRELAQMQRDPKRLVREGMYPNSYNPGQPIVMWFSKGLQTSTQNLKSKLTRDVSCICGMHPFNIQHLYGILTGRATLNPSHIVTNDLGSVEYHKVAWEPDTNKDGKVKLDKDGQPKLKPILGSGTWDVESPTTGSDVVLAPNASEKDLFGDTGGGSDKYAEKQFNQAMYWLTATAELGEGKAILNSDAAIQKLYNEDAKAVEKYYTELASNEEIANALFQMDLSIGYDGSLTNTPLVQDDVDEFEKQNGAGVAGGATASTAFGNGLSPTGDAEEAMGDYAKAMAPKPGQPTSTLTNGVPNPGNPEEETDPEKATQMSDEQARNEQEEMLLRSKMNEIQQKILDMGRQYRTIVSPAWFKEQALDFVNQLRNHFVDGLTQFTGAPRSLTYMDFFTTEPDRNLVYCINHYPPQCTGWTQANPFLANVLRTTDKELPKITRMKNFVAANKVGFKQKTNKYGATSSYF
jgi:hypothetical protein